MVLKKKSLINVLENNNEPEEEAPQPPQPQTPQYVQPQTVQTPAAPAAPRQVGDQSAWEEHLIQALAKAPADVAQKLAMCVDREILMKVLEKRDDPYLKVALLLLTKK